MIPYLGARPSGSPHILRVGRPGVKGVWRLRFVGEYGPMQLRNFDAHGNASIAREKQELAARCGLEKPALRVGEAERTLHSRRLSRSMAAEQHHRAVGRD